LKVEWRERERGKREREREAREREREAREREREREREAGWNKAGEEDMVAYLRAVCFKAGPLVSLEVQVRLMLMEEKVERSGVGKGARV
jgi:hypothetical protein